MAEDRLDVLVRDLRINLLKDAKWSLRGKEFRAFVGGLFVLKPGARRREATLRRQQKLEEQVTTCRPVLLHGTLISVWGLG